MRRASRILVTVVIITLLIAVPGCKKKDLSDIVIGVVGCETGMPQLGLAQRRAVQMAVDEINAAGGLLGGRKLRAIFEDDEMSPTKGTNAVNKLIFEDKAVAIIGALNSSVSLAMRPVVEQAKIPQLTIATGSSVTSPDYKYLFMTALSDLNQAKALMNVATDQLKLTKLAFLTASDDYGESGRKLLEQAAQAKGVTIVAQEKHNSGDKDFKTQLLKIQSAGAEGVFLWAGYADGALIVRQARELGMTAQFFAGSGMVATQLIELSGPAGEGFMLTQAFWPNPDNPKIQAFLDRWQKLYNEQPIPHGVQAYDTVYILADAIKRADSSDPTKIRDAIAATKDLELITGKFSFDSSNVIVGKTVNVITIRNGKFELVKSGI